MKRSISVRTFVHLFKINSGGKKELKERFEVDTSKPWRVDHRKDVGGAVVDFNTIDGQRKQINIGEGHTWSLGYKVVK